LIVSILPSLLIDGIESYIRKRRGRYQYKPLELYGKNNDFSIVIPAYNAEKTIEKTLKRIENYRERTIVVDDGSKDETAKIARNLGFEVIRSKENRKKIGAIKLGLENVSSTYTVLLDADSYPERSELLPNLIQALYEENLIAAGAQVLPENPSNAIEKLQYIEYKIAIEIGRRSMAKNRKNICISGAFGAYRTKELKDITEIQLKDPHWEGEDLERTLYLLERGDVGYFPDFIVRTVVPENLKGLTIQRIRWQEGYLRVHKKFYKMLKRKDEIG
jgi:cellulose synthase/poly-beta-1,6-N-acetylglucosamine synthase-like glycosyltransferase